MTQQFLASRSVLLLGLVCWLALPACRLIEVSAWSPDCRPPNVGQSDRPANILLLLTDDQDVATFWSMPLVMELLLKDGMWFSNSFVTSPLCCPSRVSLLTGQYAHNHGVLTNRRQEGAWQTFKRLGGEESTVATWLHDAGYTTGYVGKYLNLYPQGDLQHVPSGWDEWRVLHSEAEGLYSGFLMNINGANLVFGTSEEDYQTDVLGRQAALVLDRMVADSAPFFLVVATFAPHLPATPAPRHAGTHSSARLPRDPSFDEADVRDKPQWIREKERIAGRTGYLERAYRNRLESLLAVDELVGRLVAQLQDHDVLDRTFIFFTSDNGFHIGQHRLQPGKQTAYEEDIRVPLVVRGPGVWRDCQSTELVLNIDLAPTFAEIGGISQPSTVDGRSLLPLTQSRNAGVPWRSAFAVENWVRFKGDSFETFAVRTPSEVFVEWSTGEVELYDLRDDPYQIENLAPRMSPAKRKGMRSLLAGLLQCAGGTCRKADRNLK